MAARDTAAFYAYENIGNGPFPVAAPRTATFYEYENYGVTPPVGKLYQGWGLLIAYKIIPPGITYYEYENITV